MTKVLVTGGAGFLGRGILHRQYKDLGDWDVTVYSRDETKQDECRRKYPDVRYVLGDVRDADRLTMAMMGHDLVIHAAAMKYIPEAEMNVMECIAVNVEGSRNTVKAALAASVARVVGISTDKAVMPVNVYGMTKGLMERMFGEVAEFGATTFTTVRYGNVVGSTGSVIPLFQKQARENGVVTVTDPHMTRFWMGIDDAVDTVIQAITAAPGSITIPAPKAMDMGTLAAMIAGEGRVQVIGKRPGEKMHEWLIHLQESVRVSDEENPHYYELMPVGWKSKAADVTPFEVSSLDPPAGWLTEKEMGRMMEEAVNV